MGEFLAILIGSFLSGFAGGLLANVWFLPKRVDAAPLNLTNWKYPQMKHKPIVRSDAEEAELEEKRDKMAPKGVS